MRAASSAVRRSSSGVAVFAAGAAATPNAAANRDCFVGAGGAVGASSKRAPTVIVVRLALRGGPERTEAIVVVGVCWGLLRGVKAERRRRRQIPRLRSLPRSSSSGAASNAPKPSSSSAVPASKGREAGVRRSTVHRIFKGAEIRARRPPSAASAAGAFLAVTGTASALCPLRRAPATRGRRWACRPRSSARRRIARAGVSVGAASKAVKPS